MKLLCFLCIFIEVLTKIKCDVSQNPVITIATLGQVRGSFMTSDGGKSFHSFRGIPYAKAPVGELRFKEPVAADPWTDVLDATRESTACAQFHAFLRFVIGTEDCLKLNIYTPASAGATKSSLPVMVWIHGGSWFMGSGNGETDVYGPRRFLDRDIVLVTINYRLGPLGFFSTGDSEAPGNYGLFDQVMALKWVQNNIENFGGNPNLVTIFGESSGAASVHHHIISPHSKGLFHRAIAQSGSMLNSWAMDQSNSVINYSKKMAQELGCTAEQSNAILACLRDKPVKDIVFYRKKIEIFGVIPIAFQPRIDIERELPFIPASPKILVEQNKINAVPTITGLNKNEGALFVAVLIAKNGALLKNFSENSTEILSYMLRDELTPENQQLARQTLGLYLTLEKPFEEQLVEIEQMTTDLGFFKGIDETVKLLSKFNDQPTYYYLYNHRSKASLPTLLGVPPDKDLGVSHSDELYRMFSNELFTSVPVTANDTKVSNILIDLWTSFATNGVPQSDLVPGGWTPSEASQTRYLKIDAEDPSVVIGSMPFAERIKLLK